MGYDNSPAAAPPGAMLTMSVAAGSGTRTSNTIDMSGYGSFVAQWTALGTGASSAALQVSNDGVTWFSQNVETFLSGTSQGLGASSSLTTSSGTSYQWVGGIFGRYMRLSITATTTGTYTMAVLASPAPPRVVTTQSVQGANVGYGDNSQPSYALPALSLAMVYNPTTGGWNKLRAPNVFKSVNLTTSGNTVWLPTTGFKFRLMRYRMSISNNATLASANEQTIQLQDNGANIGLAETGYIPSSPPGVAGNWGSGWVDLGNGYLSTGINQPLQISLTWNFASGGVRVTVCGTEE